MMAPPSALRDRRSRRLLDPLICRLPVDDDKTKSKRNGVEPPLIISRSC